MSARHHAEENSVGDRTESAGGGSPDVGIGAEGEGSKTVRWVCKECGEPAKSAQGLAGHFRLAHSAETAQALAVERRSLDFRERALQQRELVLSRNAEASRGRELELVRREREVEDAEQVTESDRIRGIISARIASLPEVTPETILRVRGHDYRISSEGELVHVYFPRGEKTEFEDGEPFRFNGRAYCIRQHRFEPVPGSELLAVYLKERG